MIKINKRRLVKTFKELAGIYGPSKGERDVADYVLGRLGADWSVSEDDAGEAIDGEAGNILAKMDGEGDAVLLSAHLDTVQPCAGVKAKIKNGYLVSRGDTILGADNRAAVAAMLELADIAGRLRRRRPVEMLFTVAEEVGLQGAKHADYGAIESRRAFVLDTSEPPGYAVNAAPGSELVTATFRGRAAHAGIEPEKGINAIQMASSAIASMQLGRIDHETTANIGLISGGKAVNIVSEEAKIEGEVRSHDAEKLRRHVDHITRKMEKAAAEFGGVVEIKWEEAYVSYRLSDDTDPVELFRLAARAADLMPKLVAGGGGSDANVFNARGLPAIVLGCGFEKIHTTDERIAVASLAKLAELATALVTVE
ncbi:MAG: M20/M25/M40 family metallo-hydrolase [Candidatus Zixiibacteriota bacterium]|jgi:tripeptide aminopeptidase